FPAHILCAECCARHTGRGPVSSCGRRRTSASPSTDGDKRCPWGQEQQPTGSALALQLAYIGAAEHGSPGGGPAKRGVRRERGAPSRKSRCVPHGLGGARNTSDLWLTITLRKVSATATPHAAKAPPRAVSVSACEERAPRAQSGARGGWVGKVPQRQT